MQPVLVICPFQLAREPVAAEDVVEGFETGEDARHEAFDVEGLGLLFVVVEKREEGVVKAGGWTGVVGVDANAEDDLVVASRVGAVGEDAGDFDVGDFGGWLFARVAHVHVVGPFDADGEVGVAFVVGFYGFDDGDGGEVLEEDDGSRGREVGGVVDYC